MLWIILTLRRLFVVTEQNDKNQKYPPLTNEQIQSSINFLIGDWKKFVERYDPSLQEGVDYFIHQRNLFEVIDRTDRRKYYYSIFHNIEQVCEYKQIAIECYWINTLKPFTVVKENSPLRNCPNEMFCLLRIVGVLEQIYKDKKPGQPFIYPTDKAIQEIVYNFKYCDLSREAMIFFVETFARGYGIGHESLLQSGDEK